METNKEDNYSLGDITVQVKTFVQYLRARWVRMLLTVLIAAGLGAGYYCIQKPKYIAVSTFILEEKSAGGGGLAGLASQFGFNIGSLNSGGSLFAGDNILNILKSKKVVQEVLLSEVDAPGSQTLADLYLDFAGLKTKWQGNSALSAIGFARVNKRGPLQDSVLNVIYESLIRKQLLVERTSKQGTIINVQVTASNSVFARLMTERLVKEASKLYFDIKTRTADANIRQLQRRSDSLLLLLNNKSYHAAGSQPLDVNPGVRTAIVPVEIANRDKSVIAALYAEVTKNLEASKLLLSQQTPVIELLDSPGYLLDDNKKGLFILVLIFSMAGGVLYVAVSFLLHLGREIIKK